MAYTDFPTIGSDFSSIEGTNCYCSADAAARIREAIGKLPLKAVHILGTGDFHYLSLFWLEKIREPFTLYLFDNHPDNQPGAFREDILSCGNWVLEAGRLPGCRDIRWIRQAGDYRPADGCVYLSIDLDVLSPEYARTDWDQGKMRLDELCGIITDIKEKSQVLGADICGGIKDLPEINSETVGTLCKTINGYGIRRTEEPLR